MMTNVNQLTRAQLLDTLTCAVKASTVLSEPCKDDLFARLCLASTEILRQMYASDVIGLWERQGSLIYIAACLDQEGSRVIGIYPSRYLEFFRYD